MNTSSSDKSVKRPTGSCDRRSNSPTEIMETSNVSNSAKSLYHGLVKRISRQERCSMGVARGLMAFERSKLYQLTDPDIESLAEREWGFRRKDTRDFINAAEGIEKLIETAKSIPQTAKGQFGYLRLLKDWDNFSAIWSLLSFDAFLRPQIAFLACQTCVHGFPTRAHVERAASEIAILNPRPPKAAVAKADDIVAKVRAGQRLGPPYSYLRGP